MLRGSHSPILEARAYGPSKAGHIVGSDTALAQFDPPRR
jgi:hypothetical protein